MDNLYELIEKLAEILSQLGDDEREQALHDLEQKIQERQQKK